MTVSPTGATTTTPTYSWNAVANVASYNLLVQNPVGVAVNVMYTPAAVGCAAGTGACSVTPSIALAAGTNYNWFVNASNAYGTSAWSDRRQISVAGATPTPTPTPTSGPPTAATHISPIGTIATTNPVYVWNASAGATSYRLLVQSTNGVAMDLDVPATTAGCGAGTGTCSYYPNQVLTSNANWAWFLKASNTFGSSAWSTGGQFRTP